MGSISIKMGSMEGRQKYRDNASHPFISLTDSKIQTSESFPLLWLPHKMSHSGRCNATYLHCGGSRFNPMYFCVSFTSVNIYKLSQTTYFNLFYVEMNTIMLFTLFIFNFWIVCNEGGKDVPTSFSVCLFNSENDINHFHEIWYFLAHSSFC
jgi:hypothetical protein